MAGTHLASVGLYVTSYFSTLSTWLVLQETRTDVGFKNITVMFSGAPGLPPIEPVNGVPLMYLFLAQRILHELTDFELTRWALIISNWERQYAPLDSNLASIGTFF